MQEEVEQRIVSLMISCGKLGEQEFRKAVAKLLEQLKDSGAKILICTKSDLVVRDIDLLKEMGKVTVSWSINTLDEDFKNDMDNAVNIERRLAAMKAFHDAGVRTTCFISPIFPGLTDLPSIIHRAKNQCNLVWLENLNLRGGYKKTIFDYITEKHPDLLPLYDTIYNKKERSYWSMLDAQMRQFCQEEGLLYVRDDDSIKRPFNDPPIVVNYFFHEEIIPRPKCRRTGNQNYIVTCRKLEVVEVRL